MFAADKLHNVRAIVRDLGTLGPDLWRHFRGGSEGTLWYYQSAMSLAETAPLPPGLRDEFRAAVAELSRILFSA